MRAIYFGFGMFLLAIGVLIFVYGLIAIQIYQTGMEKAGIYGFYGSPTVEYGQALYMELLGAIIAIIGLGWAIYGATPRERLMIQPQVQVQQCKFCGAEMPADTIFCTECNRAQR